MVREEMQSSRTSPSDLRERAKISIEELSAGVKVSIEQLRRYERGDVNVDNRATAARLRNIANFLNCPIDVYRAAVRSAKHG